MARGERSHPLREALGFYAGRNTYETHQLKHRVTGYRGVGVAPEIRSEPSKIHKAERQGEGCRGTLAHGTLFESLEGGCRSLKFDICSNNVRGSCQLKIGTKREQTWRPARESLALYASSTQSSKRCK